MTQDASVRKEGEWKNGRERGRARMTRQGHQLRPRQDCKVAAESESACDQGRNAMEGNESRLVCLRIVRTSFLGHFVFAGGIRMFSFISRVANT